MSSIHRDPVFTREEYRRRLERLKLEIERRRLDAVILSSLENIYYLTGYGSVVPTAYQLLVVPSDRDPRIIIRYGERSNLWVRSWLQEADFYRDVEDPVEITRSVLRAMGLKRLGLELDSFSMTPLTSRRLMDAMEGIAVEDCSGMVERLRMIKSAEELRYVEAAARVSSAAVREGLTAVEEGKRDGDVAAVVYAAMIAAGGEYPPLPPLITAGEETTLFHNTWSGHRIEPGDVVFFEVPGVVRRYLAPVARTAVVGTPPSYVVERYRVALESLEAGIDAMRPGVTCAEVYHAFARPYAKAGYEVPIKVGYSVGIAFPPKWSERAGLDLLPANQTVLAPGMVFHTPRSVRVFGEQTPIISETTLITESGHRVLTSCSRELHGR